MPYSIRIRLLMMGLMVKEIALQLRTENPDHPILSVLTPDKVSKATQDNYIGSERDRFIAYEVDKLVSELEKIYKHDPCCNPIKVRQKQMEEKSNATCKHNT